MRTRRVALRGIVYPAIVALLLSATLGAAAVFMIAAYGGDGAGGPLRPAQGLAVSLQVVAFVIVVALSVQLMTTYGLVRVPPERARRLHAVLGWTIAGAMLVHAAVTLLGAVGARTVPVSFYIIDCIALAALAVQLVSGHLQAHAGAMRSALVHAWLSVPLALVVAELGILAVTEAGVSMKFC